MSSSLFYLLLLIVGSSQHASCDEAPAQASSVVDEFKKDWPYNGTDIVIYYPRQWFNQREFIFVAHDISKDYCKVNQARTDNSNYELKTCVYKFRDTDGQKVTIERISSISDISIYWFTEKLKRQGIARGSRVNMDDCWRGRYAPQKLDSETPEKPQNTSDSAPLPEDKDLPNSENIDNILKGKNFSWVGGLEGPVKQNSTEGIFFLGQKNESDPNVDAMFMELPSEKIQVLDSIEHFSLGKDQYRTSRAHSKYGECWTETPTKIMCSQQQLQNGHAHMVIFRQSATLPEPIDWFVMQNLRENAIVLITGRCSGKKCNSYTVRKLGEYESKVLVDIDNLDIECENPSSLTNDIVDYKSSSVFCFHLICNQKYTGGESGVKVQYRRHCVKRDIVTSWG